MIAKEHIKQLITLVLVLGAIFSLIYFSYNSNRPHFNTTVLKNTNKAKNLGRKPNIWFEDFFGEGKSSKNAGDIKR